MEYREGRCPKCNEVMQIPEGRDHVICMFCGQEFTIEESRQAETIVYEQAIAEFKQCAVSLFDNAEKVIKGFKRDSYADSFEQYLAKQGELLKAIRKSMEGSPEPGRAAAEIADVIVSGGAAVLDAQSGKRAKENIRLTLNMYMVTFVFPAILTLENGKYTDLTDVISRKWSENFKNSPIQAADFDSLNKGFRRKLCYITTAVCESIGRPENCYELNLIKDYRDQYLGSTPEGAELVNQYYDIAPTIVKRINKEADRREKYLFLWENYIRPCVRLIEQDQNVECRQKYTEMVELLKKEYLEDRR